MFTILITALCLAEPQPSCTHYNTLERSFWIHASLANDPKRGYWISDLPPVPLPSPEDITNAAHLLADHYHANRLYLLYHRDFDLDNLQTVFLQWRKALPNNVEIIPTLLLQTYEEPPKPVFTIDQAQAAITFFKKSINPNRAALFDVYPNRNQGDVLPLLANEYPTGLIRVGIQPDEPLKTPYSAAVQDTWTAFCLGKTQDDWRGPKFGLELLRNWTDIRNRGDVPVAWDLIVVAWDYNATPQGTNPGYDDAARNQPLPDGRNTAAALDLLRRARPRLFAGFSSDLTIFQYNSINAAHDGPGNSLYESLKSGKPYQGYYASPLNEIAAIYKALSQNLPPAPPTESSPIP